MPTPAKNPERRLHPLFQQLRDRRIARSLTQEAVARKIGYPVRCIQAWESGENVPKAPSLLDWIGGLDGEINLKFPD